MAQLNEQSEIDVPFDGPDLKCPACEERLIVVATVDVKRGTAQQVGSKGFRDPVFNVHLETNIRCFTIQHSCTPKQKEN